MCARYAGVLTGIGVRVGAGGDVGATEGGDVVPGRIADSGVNEERLVDGIEGLECGGGEKVGGVGAKGWGDEGTTQRVQSGESKVLVAVGNEK